MEGEKEKGGEGILSVPFIVALLVTVPRRGFLLLTWPPGCKGCFGWVLRRREKNLGFLGEKKQVSKASCGASSAPCWAVVFTRVKILQVFIWHALGPQEIAVLWHCWDRNLPFAAKFLCSHLNYCSKLLQQLNCSFAGIWHEMRNFGLELNGCRSEALHCLTFGYTAALEAGMDGRAWGMFEPGVQLCGWGACCQSICVAVDPWVGVGRGCAATMYWHLGHGIRILVAWAVERPVACSLGPEGIQLSWLSPASNQCAAAGCWSAVRASPSPCPFVLSLSAERGTEQVSQRLLPGRVQCLRYLYNIWFLASFLHKWGLWDYRVCLSSPHWPISILNQGFWSRGRWFPGRFHELSE